MLDLEEDSWIYYFLLILFLILGRGILFIIGDLNIDIICIIWELFF